MNLRAKVCVRLQLRIYYPLISFLSGGCGEVGGPHAFLFTGFNLLSERGSDRGAGCRGSYRASC